MEEKSVIVDDKDNPIGFKKRAEIETDDIYRVSGLWIVNHKEQILLAKRSATKTNDPGKWGPAVSGTVAQGEEYLDNILKETQEEIGIDIGSYNFKEIDKIRTRGKHNFFCQWYLLKEDLDISKLVFQKDEVDELAWVNKDDFKNILASNPEKYTIDMAKHFAILENY
jgi:isopentenyldiphosphate isomerase